MASREEQKAGFDIAFNKILKLIDTLAPNHDIPLFGNPNAKAKAYLYSNTGQAAVNDEVKSILEAAEAARAKAVLKVK